jgi:hypothetical protein
MVTCNTFCDPGLSQSLRSDARADVGVIFADSSFIGGGDSNCILPTIAAPSCHNFIGVGLNNLICAGACNSSILNGKNNCVSGNYASIFGGQNNTVTGNCSAILGGSGNNDNGVPNTGMYANGLTVPFAVPGAPSAFWVDQLFMSNIVVDTTGVIWPTLPIGTLYTTIAGPSVWGGGQFL